MQTPAGHFLGAKRDKPDTRDQRYRMAPQYGAMAAPLPPLVDLRSSLPPAFDQGETSSCGPNSAAALMCHQFPEYAKGSFSRMQIYADVRTLEDDFSLDGGVETRDLFKVLTKTGAASELLWPFDITKMFVQPPVTLAPKQKLASYARLVQEDDFLECLSEGFPFILGFICFESIDNDALARTAVMPMPDSSKEKQVGGHDVLVVGYDLNFKSSAVFKKSGVDAALVSDHALLIRNSWGTDWADAGHFWMPIGYASNPSLGGDCWTGRRDAVPTDAVPVPPKHVTPTPGQIAAAVAATRRTFDANGARWMSNDMCVKIGNSTATAVVNNH